MCKQWLKENKLNINRKYNVVLIQNKCDLIEQNEV